MYIPYSRKTRLPAILLAVLIFLLFTGCGEKVSTTPTPSPNKSPSVTASPSPSVKPSPEPGNVVIPSSTINAVHVSGLTIDKEVTEVFVGQSFNLSVVVEPDAATRKAINWTTGDEAVATVSKTTAMNTTVTAVAAGTTLIKAASEDSGKIAVCIVIVKNPIVDVTAISLSSTDLLLTMGSTFQITAAVQPVNATDKGLSWTSSAPAVAMASDDGTIMATGLGTAVITVKSINGKTATCNVRVIEALTGIAISPTAQALKVGATVTLNVNVSPAGAVKPKLIWSSSNANVATVSEGVVTGKGVGETVITVKTEEGKFSAYCTVYVSR